MVTARRLLAGLILCAALEATAEVKAPTTVVIGTPPQPSWSLLSTEQKIILAPLAREWDAMENVRRKKWLLIAERFPRMSADEQKRVQTRMSEWSSLTPDQRARIRDSYKEFKQLPAEKKQAVRQKWDAYNNLSSEEKEKLKQQAKGTAGTSTGNPSAQPVTPAAAPNGQ